MRAEATKVTGCLVLIHTSKLDAAVTALEKWHRWALAHPRKATIANSVLDETRAALAALKGDHK